MNFRPSWPPVTKGAAPTYNGLLRVQGLPLYSVQYLISTPIKKPSCDTGDKSSQRN